MLYERTHKVYNHLRISFVIQHNAFKILSEYAREMAQWLRACTICVEDLSSLLGIHVGELTTAYKVTLGITTLSSGPYGYFHVCGIHTLLFPHITHRKRKF